MSHDCSYYKGWSCAGSTRAASPCIHSPKEYRRCNCTLNSWPPKLNQSFCNDTYMRRVETSENSRVLDSILSTAFTRQPFFFCIYMFLCSPVAISVHPTSAYLFFFFSIGSGACSNSVLLQTYINATFLGSLFACSSCMSIRIPHAHLI